MLLAAGVLTWMIFWMAKNGRHLSANIESEIRQATIQRGKKAVFLVAFFTGALSVLTAVFLVTFFAGAALLLTAFFFAAFFLMSGVMISSCRLIMDAISREYYIYTVRRSSLKAGWTPGTMQT
jgi:high-affinity Fe2+/Pb2+ permease